MPLARYDEPTAARDCWELPSLRHSLKNNNAIQTYDKGESSALESRYRGSRVPSEEYAFMMTVVEELSRHTEVRLEQRN